MRSTFGRLPPDVLAAHVDDALEPEPRTHRRRGDAVLAGAGFGDDAPLAEPPRDDGLAQRVVELVRARVHRSSRFRYIRARGAKRSTRVNGVGRPA